MSLPQSIQKLNSRGQIIRNARCPMPSHRDRVGRGKLSAEFMGVRVSFENTKTWAFRCRGLGKPYHIFDALPDPDAPENEADLPAWIKRQQEGKKKVGLA